MGSDPVYALAGGPFCLFQLLAGDPGRPCACKAQVLGQGRVDHASRRAVHTSRNRRHPRLAGRLWSGRSGQSGLVVAGATETQHLRIARRRAGACVF